MSRWTIDEDGDLVRKDHKIVELVDWFFGEFNDFRNLVYQWDLVTISEMSDPSFKPDGVIVRMRREFTFYPDSAYLHYFIEAGVHEVFEITMAGLRTYDVIQLVTDREKKEKIIGMVAQVL